MAKITNGMIVKFALSLGFHYLELKWIFVKGGKYRDGKHKRHLTHSTKAEVGCVSSSSSAKHKQGLHALMLPNKADLPRVNKKTCSKPGSHLEMCAGKIS